MSSECTAEQTSFQPPDDRWQCPRCGDSGGYFFIEGGLCGFEDCNALHVEDIVQCTRCGFRKSGQEVADLMESAELSPPSEEDLLELFSDHLSDALRDIEYTPGGTVGERLEDLRSQVDDFVDGIHKEGLASIEKDGPSEAFVEYAIESCAAIAARALILADTVKR